jgi:hypothetical protein
MSDLTLYVSVAWFWSDGPGTLDIDVEIDGKPVTTGRCFPGPGAKKKPDSFGIELEKGVHRLTARSASQKAEFEVAFELGDIDQYADLCYQHYPKSHPYYQQYRPFDPASTSGHREGFTFKIQARDFGWR